MMGAKTKKELSSALREEVLKALKVRFEKNMNRHAALEWEKVRAKLEVDSEKLWSLNEMENTGGEPDVVGYDKKANEYIFFDCAPESPKGRRSLCYDREALESRREAKPKNSATDMAAEMGVELLTEEQYQELQKLGSFDTKTSSWMKILIMLENSVAPFLAIAASAVSSCTTMARSRTMRREDSVAS